jgi:hypothetical protein
MAYTKQTWTDNDAATPVNAARLGYMETGIRDVSLIADDHETRIDSIESAGYGLSTVPAGSCIVVTWTTTEPARPTARTDVVVRWRGPATPVNAIDGDEFVLTS